MASTSTQSVRSSKAVGAAHIHVAGETLVAIGQIYCKGDRRLAPARDGPQALRNPAAASMQGLNAIVLIELDSLSIEQETPICDPIGITADKCAEIR